MGWGGWDSLNPINWSVNGNSLGGALAHGAGELYTKLGGSRAGGNQIQSDITAGIKHPISAATGGLIGGRGGISSFTKIQPGWMQRMGATSNNSLRGGLSNPTVRNSALAAAAYFGGEAAFGGTGGAATAADAGAAAPVDMSGITGMGAGTGGAADVGAGAGTGAAGGAVDMSGTTLPASVTSGGGGVGGAAAPTGMTTAQKIMLGMAGTNAAAGLLNRPKNINTDPYGTGSATAQQAQNMLTNYQNGQLMPSDAQHIALWEQQQNASVKDYYAKAGLADSSMAQQAIQQVGVQAELMRQQALTNMMNTSLSMAGVSSSYVNNQVQLQIQQDQQLQQAQQNIMQTMMMYGAYSMGG